MFTVVGHDLGTFHFIVDFGKPSVKLYMANHILHSRHPHPLYSLKHLISLPHIPLVCIPRPLPMCTPYRLDARFQILAKMIPVTAAPPASIPTPVY